MPFSGNHFGKDLNFDPVKTFGLDALRLKFLTVGFLIIDEYSLLHCWLLCQIHQILTRAKANEEPFGGLTILFCGDFNQFPAIKGTPLYIDAQKLLLYAQRNARGSYQKIEDVKFGKFLWESLTHCIYLKYNFRQEKDKVYADLVSRAMERTSTLSDVEILKNRIITKTELLSDPWNMVEIVVCENLDRLCLNNESINNYRLKDNKSMVILKAEQYKKSNGQHNQLSIINDLLSQKEVGSNVSYLLYNLHLVMGAKYILTRNIYGDLGVKIGLVNGATVILKHIITHEKIDTKDSIINLTVMPKFLIVELVNCNDKVNFKFSDLPVNHYYIEPITASFNLKFGKQETTKVKKNFFRHQFPLNPAFAVTSYKIQSTTKIQLIIDLVAPKKAIYDNDAYVKLSRIKTLEGVKILRDFDLDDLNRPKSLEIDNEINRLKRLSQITIENYKLAKQI